MLSWVVADYQFSGHASLASYSLYHLLYGYEPILSSLVGKKLASLVDLDDLDVWTQYLYYRADFFRKAMPMAMETLSIA